MQADIANKRADTAYTTRLEQLEPWKLLATGLAAGAGRMVAATALATVILSRLH